ncbi:hypothetical protein MTBBW1_1790027 [Desulfamplus magnetovallimortis]|uniref:Uncharacterized protein n=1 Tax=Desulfamplus magnetovallimortis TaxID=1246637 RepID=A0A1W1HAF5_9BACT|nr:hypothetical protein MTBBW1_1790027 [Desulfamplus magnetovallimortis]
MLLQDKNGNSYTIKLTLPDNQTLKEHSDKSNNYHKRLQDVDFK